MTEMYQQTMIPLSESLRNLAVDAPEFSDLRREHRELVQSLANLLAIAFGAAIPGLLALELTWLLVSSIVISVVATLLTFVSVVVPARSEWPPMDEAL